MNVKNQYQIHTPLSGGAGFIREHDKTIKPFGAHGGKKPYGPPNYKHLVHIDLRFVNIYKYMHIGIIYSINYDKTDWIMEIDKIIFENLYLEN